ncbi:DoxX family protein [Hymenobacter puniceus]|uniref:DoxX family protein n=1 Tax=Hymenobacter sp. BT190 TaxID=2763505 RepID=UPI0016512135|nr:DoxX family protein [Hymenobacter sp. BT190]MBC6697635.1 DoxX family protein [Hymenobacter sp. BT190]
MELTPHLPATRPPRTSAGNPIWLDVLRLLLGVFLLIKGLSFLDHSTDVYYLLSQQQPWDVLKKTSLFVSFFHIVGGLMIATGTLTRFALMCQLPILLGAVLLVNSQNGFKLANTELWVSTLVLMLCLLFMIVGPGRYSIDNKVLRQAQ